MPGIMGCRSTRGGAFHEARDRPDGQAGLRLHLYGRPLRRQDARPEAGASSVAYSLPFSGAWTVLNGGVDEGTPHSWDVYTQRYAYDFVVVGEHGLTYEGDPSDARSYLCYGLPVLAPADGEVVFARDADPDTPPMLGGDEPGCAGDDIRGNFVLIRHAPGEYSCLAHLAPGGVAVAAGHHVSSGQEIGRCGCSGNSSEPHLHFHVQAGESFYASPGVPVRFGGISADIASDYGLIDPRPQPDDPLAAFPPFITRGLVVSNRK